jgi:sporulation-control protein spo0M
MIVEIKHKPSKRGEDFVAVVRLIGGKNPMKLNYVVVDLRWIGKWTVTLSDNRPLALNGDAIFYRYNQQGSENIMLQPGQILEFPVTVRIPVEGPLTAEALRYDFGVRADIEEMADPTFNTAFEIVG